MTRPASAARAVGLLALAALGIASCDAPTALESPGARDIALAWSGDTVLIAGSAVAAQVDVTVDGRRYAAARLRITSSDTTVVAVAPDGLTLEARRLGGATLTTRLVSAALADGAATVAQRVLVVPKMLVVSPGERTLESAGDTCTLTATALDADGVTLGGAPAIWSSSDTTVATVNGAGMVTARRDGDAEIRAEVGTVAAAARVLVRRRAARVVLDASAVSLDAFGAADTLAATVVDARGAPLDGPGAPTVTWTSAAPAVATVTDGRVVAVANGATWITAVAGAVRDSVPVTVRQRAARLVLLTPGPFALRSIGETVTLSARGYDRLGWEMRDDAASWRSMDQAKAYVEARTGMVTAIAEGATTVVATLDTASVSVAVTVANVPDRISLEPSLYTLTSPGDTLRLRWSVTNARGIAIPDAPVTFGSSDTNVVRTLSSGAAVAVGVGTARVVATAGTVADTAILTVVNAVAFVDIAPTVVTVASIGDTVIPPVTVRNARGDALPASAAVWRSANDAVARVTSGVIVARDAGEVTIYASSAQYPDVRDSLLVVVTNAPASIQLSADQDVFSAPGEARSYAAEVRNARLALIADYPVAWRSDDAVVATVTQTGLVTARGIGTTRIVATAGTVADTIVVTVKNTVVDFTVEPATATLTSLGDTLQLRGTARNVFGLPVAGVTPEWRTPDTLVVRALADGRVAAIGVGTARVIGTVDGHADTSVVTVTNAPASIDILATVDTLEAIGDTLTLRVLARNTRGDTLSASALSWTVSDPVVARVSATGIVTARDTGGTWVRASGGTVADSAFIVVRNLAGSLVLTLPPYGTTAAAVDTMTAPGQRLDYDAVVLSRLGAPIDVRNIAWTSSASGVATVADNGVVTAAAPGTTLIVARASDVADTVRLTVIDPRRIYVNSAVAASPRFGTLTRPYDRIQDAVDAAGVDDTVIVQVGNGYSEAVVLGRRVTLLGDSAAYAAQGRDPLRLPMLHHDLGTAGISASTPGASYTIAYLAIQHSVDGEAIAVQDAANVRVENVHVNPLPGFRAGRGILLERVSGSASVLRSRVDSVYGFGVRLHDVAAGRVDAVTVRGIGARTGYSGAGVELDGGQGGVVTAVDVQRTAGPQVLFTGTTDASLLASALAGEQQLARLSGVRGATTVRGNTFDLRRRSGDPLPTRGGSTPDPSGLEVTGGGGVLVDANAFVDIDGRTSLMDGVRLTDVRAAGGMTWGATLSGNRFGGGRTAVRSTRSTWRMTGSRADSAGTAVLLGATDTVALASDTLADARTAAVQSADAGVSLTVTDSRTSGAAQALVVSGGARLVARRNAFVGGAGAASQPTLGLLDLATGSAEVVQNTITGAAAYSGVMLRAGAVRLDSNFIARNAAGVRVGTLASLAMTANALLDNDALPETSMRGARALVATSGPVAVGANWWGDGRGPARPGVVSPTVGDSVIGTVVYDSLAAPIAAHAGSGTPATMRRIAGDNQIGVAADTTDAPLVVRVVDAAGRPLAGASVTFKVLSGNSEIVGGTKVSGLSQRVLTTDASGLASAWVILDTKRGTTSVSVTAGTSSMTFTVTVP